MCSPLRGDLWQLLHSGLPHHSHRLSYLLQHSVSFILLWAQDQITYVKNVSLLKKLVMLYKNKYIFHIIKLYLTISVANQ